MNKSTGIIVALIIGVVVMANWPPPKSLNLAVPFTDQAPTGKWDRNEDCEETSITMANAFLNGNRDDKLPPAVALEYINALKNWEGLNIGYNADTGAYATSHMAEGAFGLNVKQIKDFTETQLKKELAKNHVILLPINARLLGNATYAESGPFYHMIVIRGYDGHNFIVNDPGTEKGNGMIYSFETLQKSAADWNNSAQIMDSSIKIALVLSK